MTTSPDSTFSLSLPEQQLEGHFTSSSAPVQAEGFVAGIPFYFRARHTSWSFAVASGAQADPVLVSCPTEGFLLTGTVPGGQAAASYLSLQDATAIIRSSAIAYLNQRAT